MTSALDELFAGSSDVGRTDAAVVMRHGAVVAERYRDGVDDSTTLPSWSMAKSMLHAAVGVLVEEGHLDVCAPAPVPEWADPQDPRSRISLWDLLTMRSGLAWVEDPLDSGAASDVVEMLYGVRDEDGRHGPHPDTAAYAASKALVVPPGSEQLYSSGCSAIVSRVVADVVGPGEPYLRFLRERLFDPIGMDSASPRLDPSGSWMASSYCYCTARDFARFGELYRRGGVTAAGARLLAGRWVDTAAVATGRDERGRVHTCHWWRFLEGPPDAFHASGWLGQYVIVVPSLGLVVVRLGETRADRSGLDAVLGRLIDEHATTQGTGR